MTKEELLELLEAMYGLSGTYSDEQISEDEYLHYKQELEHSAPENVKELIQDIVYRLDIRKPIVARQIAYPFRYNSYVQDWVEDQIQENAYYCSACQQLHSCDEQDMGLRMTIDHQPALSVRFNQGEWKLSKEERYRSYNDTNRMQLMCQSKNSRKGGEQYNQEYIRRVFIQEL